MREAGERYTLNYWVHLPSRRPSKSKAPILIFLHGYGERAITDDPSEARHVLVNGPPKLVVDGNDLCFDGRCFLMLAPQAPPGHEWWGPSLVPMVDALIDRALALGGDPARVYLTGLSMGGYGTWAYAGAIDVARGDRLPGRRLAAIVPIAGAANGFTGCTIARAGVAVWAFHGIADPLVPPLGSIGGVADVNNCRRPRPKERALLTLYRGVGHDSWTRTYDPRSRFDPKTGRPSARGVNVYEWLLRHHR
jgi:predicted peptidase